VAQDTKEQLAARLAESKRDLENLQAESRAWLEGHIKNPHLASNTREVYRLRLLKDYRAGHQALRDGDYALAYNLFAASLSDPNASPVSRYLALDYMRAAAAKMKDLKKYCDALRQQGELASTEDLSVLGISKDPHNRQGYEESIKILMASRDSSVFDALVEARMRDAKDQSKRSEVVEKLRREIRLREEIFND
jgi:ribosomal protein L29